MHVALHVKHDVRYLAMRRRPRLGILSTQLLIMARRTKNSSKPSAAAVLPAKPARKIVFDDDAELETEGEPAGNALDQQQDEDHDMEDAALEVDPESAEDSDDDAAPEAVGVAEVKEQQAAARAEQAA